VAYYREGRIEYGRPYPEVVEDERIAEEIAEALLASPSWEVRAVLPSGFPFWGTLWLPVKTIEEFYPELKEEEA